ncbi:ethylene-responsive transcription factor-like protein At4g13040 isoform X2 [Prosopis cineraria]|uniref:ethylene-responsive transcription factor-like protein At4g13040 isoform X2 n=1 Tax=Prosopis cineraria TaxID=364024 RepID=UPI0024102DFB|nr:ethylene-responsive transcription factor-like protein At4g13040 isoform X2 [Prosopis cineraria]
MVSLRRRRLLGLCSGNSSFVTPLPLYCENLPASQDSAQHAKPKIAQSDNGIESILHGVGTQLLKNPILKEEPASSNVSGSSSSKEQSSQQFVGPPIKRRKPHRRKHMHSQESCVMRGVYFKNMKWQAAIKVDKKQIHLGTVNSQEEAARLYDRAAFMCGREPNFELSEKEKQELSKLQWDEFLAFTRQSITSKKHKRRLGSRQCSESEPPQLHDGDGQQGVDATSASEDADHEASDS